MNLRVIGLSIAGAIAVLLGITIIFGSWYTIDQGERGVVLRNGRIIGTASPGLGFKMPLIDSVVRISVQSQLLKYDKQSTYSRDQQTAEIRLSVSIRATESNVDDLYAQYGGLQGAIDRLISPKVYEELKTVFGQYNAVTAIQERARLNTDVRNAITKAAQGLVTIENVQIENIDFSDAYEKSIEQRMLAEVEVQKIRQNAEREKVSAEITVTQATAQANAVRQRALAEAEAIKLRGEAEAAAISARGKALGDNPHLVTLVQAERWDGKLPVTMVPGGAVPMITVGK
jgi:regulator of protease activity HflC (stomatin/prohibitin superfamily)